MRKQPQVRDALSRSGRSVTAEATDQQQLTDLVHEHLGVSAGS